MTEGYAAIVNLLQTTYTTTDDKVRRQAEDQLIIMSRSYDTMILTLLEIISAGQDHHLRQSAAARLRLLIRSLLEESRITSSVEKCSISEQIFDVLTSPIPKSIKEVLGSCLTNLISDNNSGVVATKLHVLCNQHLRLSIPAVQGSLICVKSIFSMISADFSTKDMFDKLLPTLANVGNTYLESFYKFLGNNSEAAFEAACVLNAWADTFSQILEHFEMISPKTVKLFLKEVRIAEIFLRILDFKVNETGLAVFGENVENKELTKAKIGVLKSLNVILQFTIDSKKKLIEEQAHTQLTTLVGMDLPENPFVNITWSIISQLIEILVNLGKNVVFSNIPEDFQKEFVIESLNLLHKCCAESRFFNVFAAVYKELINFVIISSLRYSDEEKDLVTRNPQEFVDMGMDICERQDSETVKTVSARLLEAICDNIDGALTYVVNLLSENFFQVFEERVKNLSDPRIFKFSSEEEEKIDCSFLILSTLNYNISKRTDLVVTLNNMLGRYEGILTQTHSATIQSRLCLFLYFLIEHLHSESPEKFYNLIDFIVNCMTPQNPFEAGIIQACDTFSAITQDEEVMLKMHQNIEKIFNKLITSIYSQKQYSFFESIGEFLNWYSEISHEQVVVTIDQLVKKILVEVHNDRPLAGKCWNVVRAVLNSEFLPVNQITVYEELMVPVYQLLQFPEKLAFEEDIILVILTAIKKTKSISKIQWEILSILGHYQMKQEDSLQGLLKLISCYLQYGKNFIQETPAILESLVEMSFKALYSKKSGVVRESNCCDGAVLLQLLLTSFPGYLDKYLPLILEKAYLRYTNPPISFNFFKIRLLQVFLAAFAYNFIETAKILQLVIHDSGVTCFRFVVLEIINNYPGFKYEFDRKIAMVGFGELLMNMNLNQELQELASHVFEVLIVILSGKSPYDSLKQTKLNLLVDKIMKDDLDGLGDSEIIVKGTKYMMSEANNPGSEESEAMMIIVQVMSSFHEYDEYNAFKQTLNFLNEKNSEWTKNRIASLPETRKKELIDVVASQKVKLSIPGNSSAVRKIAKPSYRKF